MQKLIICTVGTSITNGCPSQREIIREIWEWDDPVSDFATEVREKIRSVKREDIRKLSAETNSLDRIGVLPDDMVVLLASDNAPGRVSAESLRTVLVQHFALPESRVEVKRIKGLQVHDSEQLRTIGLKNFVHTVLEYLENPEYNKHAYETILNPTGGFKGVLPFLTTLGMLYGKKSVYIFEFSGELITLPPLPFSFDLHLFERVKPGLQHLEQSVAVSEQEFLSKVLNYVDEERNLFLSFTEPMENKVTISPLAYGLLSMDEGNEKPLIAESALKELGKIDGVSSVVIKRLIMNSNRPVWRNNHSERWHSTDLLVIKQSRTAERIAGFVRDRRFHVTNVFSDHDVYERTLSKISRRSFDNSVFVEWNDAGDVGVEETDRDALAEERDLLLIEKRDLQEAMRTQQEAAVEQEAKLDLALEELREYKKLCETLQREQLAEKSVKEETENIATPAPETVLAPEKIWRKIFGRKKQ
ncbi:putative CRISPR-associated protein [Spirochaeta dissipatitropha]